MNAGSLTILSGAMLLLAVQSFCLANAQEPASAPAQSGPAPADAQTQREEREAAEPAVSAPAVADPTVTDFTVADPTVTDPAVADAAVAEPAAGPAAAAKPSPAGTGRFRTMDRLELESTAITGNRELPKVLYIVPWKKADLGDLIGRPANSLLDEVLTPVDRDVFRRQTEYFSKLDAAPAGGAVERPLEPAPEPAPAPK